MAVIRPAAESAAALQEQQDAAAEQTARDQLVAAARLRVEALPAPDGKLPLAGQAKAFTVPFVDVASGLVVLTDGDVALAVQGDEVRWVRLIDGEWTRASEPIRNLAELGEVLP